MRKIKIGVLGCGQIAQIMHLPYLSASDEFSIYALCDVSVELMRAVGFEYGVPEERQYDFSKTTLGNTTILDIPNDVLVAELGLQFIFPERESQRCILVSPVMDFDAAMELVSRVTEDNPEYAQPFSWAEDGQ